MPKFQDLTGYVNEDKTLKVLKRVDDHIYPSGKTRPQYKCLCLLCGNTFNALGNKISSGAAKSCGCLRAQTIRELKCIDYKDKHIGTLTVVQRLEGSNWLCKCDCGNEITTTTSNLTRSLNGEFQITCGAWYHKTEDLSGQQIGQWTVMYRAKDKSHNVYWHCRCSCGNEKDVSSASLRKKISLSCGCTTSKIEDLTGRRFGILTVIEQAEDRVYASGAHKTNWKCQCDCGNITFATTNLLKRGEKKSCGCIKKKTIAMIAKQSAIKRHGKLVASCVGEKYERLTIEYIVKTGGTLSSTIVHCKCDCGNEKDLPLLRIVRQDTKSCGCLQRERAGSYAFKDLTGKKIGLWDVLYQNGHSKSGIILWHCRCNGCGKEYDVQSGNLHSECSTMCTECSHKMNGENLRIDLTNRKFGKLFVIGFDSVKNNNTQWLCECECGKQIVVSSGSLTSGNTRSCGCWHRSKYEDWFIQYFNELGYEFDMQIKFDDLTGIKESKLSYDFCILYDNEPVCFIECQGQQHYKPVDIFGGEEQFEVQQLHDELKREYAFEELHVPLIEIPYTATEDDIREMLEPGGSIWEFIDCYKRSK